MCKLNGEQSLLHSGKKTWGNERLKSLYRTYLRTQRNEIMAQHLQQCQIPLSVYSNSTAPRRSRLSTSVHAAQRLRLIKRQHWWTEGLSTEKLLRDWKGPGSIRPGCWISPKLSGLLYSTRLQSSSSYKLVVTSLGFWTMRISYNKWFQFVFALLFKTAIQCTFVLLSNMFASEAPITNTFSCFKQKTSQRWVLARGAVKFISMCFICALYPVRRLLAYLEWMSRLEMSGTGRKKYMRLWGCWMLSGGCDAS